MLLLVLTSGVRAEPPAAVQSFVQRNCLDCHQGSDAEAGLDLETLSADLSDPATVQRWVQLFDRVREGEMPPKEAAELDAAELQDFVETSGSWIRDWQLAEQQELGRVRSRRLTNLQLERTLHDLLAIDVPLARLMPDEPRTDGFTGIADGQSMSHFQLETHLQVVDAALDAAFDRVTDSPQLISKDFTARQIARRNPRQRNRDPEMIDGLAVVWSSRLIFYGRISSTTVPESGWYRVTFTASAVNKPPAHGVWCTVRSGECTSGAPLLSWIGSFEATDEPKELTYDAWIPKGHRLEIRPGDTTLKMGRFNGGQVGAGEGTPQNLPGVALHKMNMQRIYPGGDLDAVRHRLFGDLNVDIDRKSKQIKLVADDPARETAEQLRVFARRAFRRPVSEQTLQPYLQMLQQQIAEGTDPIAALRGAYRSVLCSPRFLYFAEAPGPLDPYAVASRLSYLLTGSMPDAELTQLAEAGELRSERVLHQQVDRLLGSPRGQDFVADFAAQWLDLVDIDFTEPDRRMYPQFDIVVQNAMLEETHRFLQSLIDTDAGAVQLIDADHTFLNSRLSRYYGIDGADSDQMQKVSLPRDSHRGGILTQGAILKVTANGTNTSPVLRGIWVSERILGQPIPPPPENVPAIEPDVRGAKTIREMLEKHRADDACASCHRKIDPPGYALENFDPAGRWRDHYVQGGRPRKRVPIDPSFKLPDGQHFEDVDEFRNLIAADPKPIARNFAQHVMVYGTGAPISFADRDGIERSVASTETQDYGLRSLIKAVVASPLFLSK
jgi:hypothetical protein